MITREQCRAARALKDWSQTNLSEHSSVSISSIKDFESGKRTPHTKNLTALRSALEAGGVVFIPENGGGAGVRLKS